MKIIHAVGWYYPESGAGTETYVAELVKELAKEGFESIVAAPSVNNTWEEYDIDGVNVVRYPWIKSRMVGEKATQGTSTAEDFAAWIMTQGVDIYHQHSWIPGCGLEELRSVRKRNIKTVITIHLPSVVCMRGTMMLFGAQPCNGLIKEFRCGRCWGESRGAQPSAAWILAHLPVAVASWASRRAGNWPVVFSALATRSLVRKQKAELERMWREANRVIAVRGWVRDALYINGTPREKVRLCEQGVSEMVRDNLGTPKRDKSGVLRIGYLGRWNPVKGIDLVADAIKSLGEDVNVIFEIHGIAQNAEEKFYKKQVLDKLGAEKRIVDAGPLVHEKIYRTLSRFDLLAVPSRWLETGPLVILEAFGAGIPVIGSNLGGIGELVKDGVDGILLPVDDVKAWAAVIEKLSWDSGEIRRLRRGVKAPKTMKQVAHEMTDIYKDLTT